MRLSAREAARAQTGRRRLKACAPMRQIISGMLQSAADSPAKTPVRAENFRVCFKAPQIRPRKPPCAQRIFGCAKISAPPVARFFARPQIPCAAHPVRRRFHLAPVAYPKIPCAAQPLGAIAAPRQSRVRKFLAPRSPSAAVSSSRQPRVRKFPTAHYSPTPLSDASANSQHGTALWPRPQETKRGHQRSI